MFEDHAAPSPGKSFLSNSILHEQADTLRQDKEHFEEKEHNFNSERQQFTHAAKKLDKDRARVQAANIQLPMTPIQGVGWDWLGLSCPLGTCLSHKVPVACHFDARCSNRNRNRNRNRNWRLTHPSTPPHTHFLILVSCRDAGHAPAGQAGGILVGERCGADQLPARDTAGFRVDAAAG